MLRRVGSGEVLSPGYCPGIFSKRAGPRLQFRLEIAEYVVSVIEERYRSVFRVDPTVQAGPDHHEGEGVARLRRAADPPRMELFERYGDFDGVTRVFPLRRTADAPVRLIPQCEEAAPFGKDVLPSPELPIRIDDEFEIEVLLLVRPHEEFQRVSQIDPFSRLPEGVDLLIRETHGDIKVAVAPARQPERGAGLRRFFVAVHDELP